MRFRYSVAALVAPILLCTAAAETPAQALRTLTTAHEAHDISLEEAARGFPVSIRGVVVYYDPYVDPRHAALFVHDSTGSIFLPLPSHPILPLKAGTLVEVTGVSGTGDYAPVILKGHVKVIGTSQLPKTAPQPTMAELLAGSEDGQWVEMAGIVHSVHLMAVQLLPRVPGKQQKTTTRLSTPKFRSAGAQFRCSTVIGKWLAPAFCFLHCTKLRSSSRLLWIPMPCRLSRLPNFCGSRRGWSCGTALISEAG